MLRIARVLLVAFVFASAIGPVEAAPKTAIIDVQGMACSA